MQVIRKRGRGNGLGIQGYMRLTTTEQLVIKNTINNMVTKYVNEGDGPDLAARKVANSTNFGKPLVDFLRPRVLHKNLR